MRHTMLALPVLLLATTLAACAPQAPAPDDATPDASADAALADASPADASPADAAPADAAPAGDGAFAPAPHPPLPQIPSRGGPVLRRPHVVLVTVAGDAHADRAVEVSRWLMGSSWLRDAVSEYGFEAGQLLQHASLATPLPATLRPIDVANALVAAMNDAQIPTPDANPDTLYVLLVPDANTLVSSSGRRSCAEGIGYHGEVMANVGPLVFGAFKVCPEQTETSAAQALDIALGTIVLQAILNPQPTTAPAHQLEPTADHAWARMMGNELVGWCAGITTVQAEGYRMPTVWSNAAAAASRHPCVPNAGATYYTITPPSEPLVVPPGGSVTVPLAAWSSAPIGSWGLSALAVGGPRPEIEISALRARNGDVPMMTVTMPESARSGAESQVYLYSQRSQDDWFYTPLLLRVE